MSIAPLLAFDEEAPRGNGEVGATQKIARALDAAGLDAPTSLYDEALALAQEGRLAPAAERLRMLLTLDSSDGDAALLLAKVLAARELWQEALSWLDTATSNDAITPPGLRDLIEDGLRRQVQDTEEYRNRMGARDRGEVKNLRAESKKLRATNAALEVEIEELQRRVRLWSGATAIVAGTASALLLAAALFGGGEAAAVAGAVAGGAVATEALPELPAPTMSAPGVPAATLTAAGAGFESAPAEVMPSTFTPAVAPAAAVAPPPIAKPTATATATGGVIATHTVRKGDTLGSLAKKYYGNQADWPKIKDANKSLLKGKDALSLGMKLQIPAQ